MCNFFSFVHDGREIYYFSADQRKNGVKMPDGNGVGSFDSHSSITCFYGLDDDGVNKFEYNPYTDRLTLDGKTVCTWDEATIRQQLAKIDWLPLAGDVQGMREFLTALKTIPWLQLDGSLHDGQDGICLYDTWVAAWDAAWDAARDAARNAAWDAARDAARDAAQDAAWDAAWDAAQDAARNAAWNAAWDAAQDAAWDTAQDAAWDTAQDAARDAAWNATWDAALYSNVMYVCAGLPIAAEHVEHIRKRMDVWRHGYGVACDVDGVLYCYERL